MGEAGRQAGRTCESYYYRPRLTSMYLFPLVQLHLQWPAAPPGPSSWPPPPLSSAPGRSDPVASRSHSYCGSP